MPSPRHREPGSRKGCSSDWTKDCGGPNNTSLENCRFADDFGAMVKLVKTLGTTAAGPKVYVMIPPPLMRCCRRPRSRTIPRARARARARARTHAFASKHAPLRVRKSKRAHTNP